MAVATQRGAASDDYGAGCPDTANGCTDMVGNLHGWAL
jgi:hypothetical protein